ncbi:MAG: hypothetical protein ABID40_04845 [Candidatus Bipolaricaulota bacterium]
MRASSSKFTIIPGVELGASVSINRGIELDASRLDIFGDVFFAANAFVGAWRSSRVLREYVVSARTSDGRPVPGVRLDLEDPAGGVTQHVTDQEGNARITVTFTDADFNKTWKATAYIGDTPIRTTIGLFTSTPIVITRGQ